MHLGPPAYSFSVSDFWDSDFAHAQSLTESGSATVWYAKFDNLKKHRPDVPPCDVSPSFNLWLTRRSESCLSSRIHRTFPASTMFDQLWLNKFGPLNFLPPWPTWMVIFLSPLLNSELRTIGDAPPPARRHYLIWNSQPCLSGALRITCRHAPSLSAMRPGRPSAWLTQLHQLTGADRCAQPLYFGPRV